MTKQSANDLPVDEDRKRHFTTLISLSDQFGNSITSAFAKNIAEGKKFDDVLKSVRRSLVETGLKMALAPLQIGLSQGMKSLSTGLMGTGSSGEGSGGLLDGLVKGLGSIFGSMFGGGGNAPAAGAPVPGFANGGVFSRGQVMPFAQGGVVSAPSYFPLGRGLGVMGEKGAEAVMPLARGPDGRLGVRSGGGGRPDVGDGECLDAGCGKFPPLRSAGLGGARPRGGARPTRHVARQLSLAIIAAISSFSSRRRRLSCSSSSSDPGRGRFRAGEYPGRDRDIFRAAARNGRRSR